MKNGDENGFLLDLLCLRVYITLMVVDPVEKWEDCHRISDTLTTKGLKYGLDL